MAVLANAIHDDSSGAVGNRGDIFAELVAHLLGCLVMAPERIARFEVEIVRFEFALVDELLKSFFVPHHGVERTIDVQRTAEEGVAVICLSVE